MNDFIFCSPTRFVFGRGVTDKAGAELASQGFNKVLLVYGGGSVERLGTLARVRASLDAAGVSYVEAGGVRPNPEVSWVREALELARAEQVDGLLAVGGGSAIDAAKAIGVAFAGTADVWDYFTKAAEATSCLPIAVVLTIPAAGSEGSGSCVISNDEQHRKLGLSTDLIRPKIALLDPELSYTLPAYQTAAGVTDMIAHVCERYFSGVGAVALTDKIAAGIIRTLIEAAPRAIAQPTDYDARANIMWAGTLAHNDLAGCGRSLNPGGRAGGWESHGLEHELSAHHVEITHGAGLAVIMPAWMRYVWKQDPTRFLQFAADVFDLVPEGGAQASEQEVERVVTSAIDQLQDFFQSIGMPASLADFGLGEADIDPLLVTLRQNKGDKFGAFMPLTIDDARAIYLSAL
ncbi:MAG: iron-containing alcohol dehydrogenase [Coriobacteriales bacterium]|nr:iron-containing alcohol dehydrogenase [Coriobacteriales bacterium]